MAKRAGKQDVVVESPEVKAQREQAARANVLTRICLMLGCGYDDNSILQRLEIDCRLKFEQEDLIAIKHSLGFAKEKSLMFISFLDRLGMDIRDLFGIIRSGDIWKSVELGKRLHEVCSHERYITLSEIDGFASDERTRHTAAIKLGFKVTKDLESEKDIRILLFRNRGLMEQSGIKKGEFMAYFNLQDHSDAPDKPKPMLSLKRGQKLF